MSKTESRKPRRLPPLLRRAWYGLNQAFRQRIAHLKITPDQFSILRWLSENSGGLTQRDLTELLASDPNTVASTLRRMEQAGFVDRDVHEGDRRARRVRLTMMGKRKFSAGKKVAISLQNAVLAALPEGSREKFLADLEAVGDSCQRVIAAAKSAKRER